MTPVEQQTIINAITAEILASDQGSILLNRVPSILTSAGIDRSRLRQKGQTLADGILPGVHH